MSASGGDADANKGGDAVKFDKGIRSLFVKFDKDIHSLCVSLGSVEPLQPCYKEPRDVRLVDVDQSKPLRVRSIERSAVSDSLIVGSRLSSEVMFIPRRVVSASMV